MFGHRKITDIMNQMFRYRKTQKLVPSRCSETTDRRPTKQVNFLPAQATQVRLRGSCCKLEGKVCHSLRTRIRQLQRCTHAHELRIDPEVFSDSGLVQRWIDNDQCNRLPLEVKRKVAEKSSHANG